MLLPRTGIIRAGHTDVFVSSGKAGRCLQSQAGQQSPSKAHSNQAEATGLAQCSGVSQPVPSFNWDNEKSISTTQTQVLSQSLGI